MNELTRSHRISEAAPVPLSSVVATEELFLRPARSAPDYAAEGRALVDLAHELGNSPQSMMQKLAQTALTTCRAHSAGISLLDEQEGQPVFRWPAIAGEWAEHVGFMTPRDFSPCGVVLARNSPQLFVRFDRHYSYLRVLMRPTHEALMVPFLVSGEAAGTLWILSHDDHRRFDAEDLRLLSSIGKFAATALGLWASLEKQRRVDRNKDEFLATLAHELRGPLAPLINCLHVMRAAKGNTDVIEHARNVMDRQLGHLARLVDELFDKERIRLGKVRLDKGRTELATVVRSAVETSFPSIEERAQDLTIDLPPEPIVVDVDGPRLAQVLSNLLGNAAKFAERDGHIRLSVSQRGPEILISVKDDGVGISAEMLPTIFDLFAQAPETLGKARGGLGIGLHMSKRLVELHGGSLVARSDGPGLGSEFVVSLPIAPALASDAASCALSHANSSASMSS
jgi:signal transduction histidine kinase